MCHDAQVLDATVDEPLSDDITAQIDAPSPADVGATIPIRGLVVVGVLVTLLRWWFSHDRTAPHLAPDEPAQLAMARFLSGGVRWNMFDHSTWRPGLATLIAPLFWVFDNGETIVRGALAVNAVIAGLAGVYLARLTARITDLSTLTCCAVAVVVASSPSALSGSGFVWAESLVTLTFTATVWSVLRFLDTDHLRHALAAVAWSVAGFTSHSRLAPLLLMTVAIVVGLLAWRREWQLAAFTGSFAILLGGISYGYASYLFDRVWDRPASNNTVGTVWKRLDDVGPVLSSVLGQFWYQAVATVGLGLIGGAVVTRALVRPTGGLRPAHARVLAAVTLPLVLVSATFMSARTRSDHLVYGRYNDAVLWPVLVIGIAWFVRRARTGYRRSHLVLLAAAAAVTVASAIGIDALNGSRFDDDIGVRAMVAGLLPFVGDRDAIPVGRITVIALIAIAVVTVATLAARRSQAAVAVAVVAAIAVLAFAGYRTHHAEGLRLNSWAAAKSVKAIEPLLPPGSPVGVSMVPDADKPALSWERQRQRYQLYQLHLPGHPFLRDRGPDDSVGPYVLAPADDPTLRAAGADVLWTDPNARVSLWKERTSERANDEP